MNGPLFLKHMYLTHFLNKSVLNLSLILKENNLSKSPVTKRISKSVMSHLRWYLTKSLDFSNKSVNWCHLWGPFIYYDRELSTIPLFPRNPQTSPGQTDPNHFTIYTTVPFTHFTPTSLKHKTPKHEFSVTSFQPESRP